MCGVDFATRKRELLDQRQRAGAGVASPRLGRRGRRRVERRTDPRAALRQARRTCLPCRYRALLRLVQVIDFANVLGGVHQLEADALAMTASREPPALNDRHLVRHVGMLGVMVIR